MIIHSPRIGHPTPADWIWRQPQSTTFRHTIGQDGQTVDLSESKVGYRSWSACHRDISFFDSSSKSVFQSEHKFGCATITDRISWWNKIPSRLSRLSKTAVFPLFEKLKAWMGTSNFVYCSGKANSGFLLWIHATSFWEVPLKNLPRHHVANEYVVIIVRTTTEWTIFQITICRQTKSIYSNHFNMFLKSYTSLLLSALDRFWYFEVVRLYPFSPRHSSYAYCRSTTQITDIIFVSLHNIPNILALCRRKGFLQFDNFSPVMASRTKASGEQK